MTPKERAANYARVFPKYPPLRSDTRWLDGFWVMGQDYRGSGFHGSYPPGFLKRVEAIFPEEWGGRVLHLFSGSLDASVPGIRLDLKVRKNQRPTLYGDAHRLPFASGTFDLIIADPPYTPEDAKKYGTPMINRRAVMAEAARILKPGGHLIWLDTRSPMFRKLVWHWWGIIGIARSTNHVYRAVTFYRREKNTMKSLDARIKEAAPTLAQALAILLGEDVAAVAKSSKKPADDDDDEDEKPAKRGPGRPKKVVAEDDDEDEKPKKKLKAPVADDDDDDEDKPKIPKDAALGELDRAALKALAVKVGIDAAGKNRDDLTAALKEIRDGGGKKKKPVADDDDEDAAPAKKKKPAADDDEEEDEPKKKKKPAADDDDDKPGEDDYPEKTSLMKADLEVFFKVNKEILKDTGFFGGKPKKGAQKAESTYDEVMADKALIKEAWADNVWPLMQEGKWKKTKAAAAEIEDEDDDE